MGFESMAIRADEIRPLRFYGEGFISPSTNLFLTATASASGSVVAWRYVIHFSIKLINLHQDFQAK